MNNITKIGKTILVEGAKGVALSAGFAVVFTIAKGGMKTVKDIQITDLIK